MPIDSRHPEYEKFSRRWLTVEHVLDGEDIVKEQGTRYLSKTSGMAISEHGERDYAAYLERARIFGITQRSHTGIIGLMFEKPPEGVSDTDKIVTNTGLNRTGLAREMARAVVSSGRDILVVDSPIYGGTPYIARYKASSMINWTVDASNPNRLTMALFSEQLKVNEDDIYDHDTATRYRRYIISEGSVEVEVFDNNGQSISEASVLEVPQEDPENPILPIFIAGSIDSNPSCDPVPLLLTARCEISAYQISADYRLALWQSAQPTAWVSGVEEAQFRKILKQGIGSSAIWPLGDSDAKAGYLEVRGEGIDHLKDAIKDEKEEAEVNAVRLTTGSRAESAETVRLKSSQQHASIYTIADSISVTINQAEKLRSKWASEPPQVDFSIQTDFSNQQAYEKLIGVLDRSVNSFNTPRTVLFAALRKSGLTEKTDEELDEELSTQGLGIGEDFTKSDEDPE